MIKNVFFLFLGMLGTVLFSALFIFLFANSVQMTCQRQQGNTYTCVVEKRLFGKLTTSRTVLNGVIGAQVEQSCDSDGCSYRTDLVAADGSSTPFNDVYTDNGPVVERTNQINTHFQHGETTFVVEEPLQLWVVFLVGGLGVMGLGLESLFVFREAYSWAVNRR